MAFLGQWLGFETPDDRHIDGKHVDNRHADDHQTGDRQGDQTSSSGLKMGRTASPPLVISRGKKPAPHARTDGSRNGPPLRKTKSDEILSDFDAMRFLCTIDETLKRQEKLLTRDELDRLQTLHAQANADECALLMDIIDHFEMEHEKLRYRLANAAPGSAASDALRSRRNMLVF